MKEKEFWISFVEGKISVDEMLKTVKKQEKYLDWLNSVVKPEEMMRIDGINGAGSVTVKFEAKKYIESQLNSINTKLAKHLNIFSTIADVLSKAFPNENIKIDKTIENKFIFMLKACPEYIGGEEADKIVEKVFEDNPKISAKNFKDKIKQIFNIEKKYPRWLQSPEWPVSKNGKPLKFVKQSYDKKNFIDEYYFEDVDTKEIVVVKQYT